MKTTSYLRMFIIAATMTAIACSEPEIVPNTTTGTHNQTATSVFHTTVTSWSRPDGSGYVGVVSTIPDFNLAKSKITVIGDNMTAEVDNFFDVTKVTYNKYYGVKEAYLWASIENNILLLHFVGPTPDWTPPFSLDVKIVY